MSIPLPHAEFQWDHYDSKVNPVNGHVECTYRTLTCSWSAPRFVESPFLQVHGLAPGLNYGQQAFEGLLAHRTARNRILIFRPASHSSRFRHSASVVSMPPVPESLFLACVHMAVARNAEFVPPHNFAGNMYIRPLEFGSSAQIGLDVPDEFTFCVFVQPHVPLHGHTPLRALVAEEFDRAATRGTGNCKVGGNYGPVLKWSKDAKKPENGGWSALLHVDSKTQSYVDEFSAAALIGVKSPDQESTQVPILTVAHSEAAIHSITAESVVTIAQSFGWTVERRLVKLEELSSFSEVFAVGTAATIRPCSLIYHRSTGKHFTFTSDGPYYQRLWKTLSGIQKGEIEDIFQWCQDLRFEEFGERGHNGQPTADPTRVIEMPE
ncbi:related to branched-chain amino acid aminotransferase [Fusarium fujikuroi]|uniref:Aminotransferase apf4 n=1 Tax=Gibberella fujikuroi (strain CBS 195.34 / IMI 58289 / NRRL A-6831) TaxID=1279085 RepID=APF4_GIBF5|nr:related to branched-chain amino acid aminotransferase [Fusarium fujikuroi IMI 58289]S0DS11.1 RecName: Full=Aminotransferase apf4; AltName: Full=Apicidin F synthesis protein 4 [Fusarium fujikuroi IMI 58289]KLO98502.1 branched-chain amino acid aminotransferase [Fusarium fujikuroi]KLP14997.1 branched-chain amino acid aminotransferase [Fusarium fujikuroi]CCT63353.1 related to branched-chain amino acid aminotransferase [Fusarium fujikuroi IMI 58289]SCN65669.1 related to branched-chain amino acid